MPRKKTLPSVGAGAFIIDSDERILLVKGPYWKNEFMIPGEHVELGEKILDAARRAAKEELGLVVKPLGVIAVAEDIFPKSHVQKKHYVYFNVLCRPKSKKVEMDGIEVTAYKWVDVKQALKIVRHPIIKRTLRTYMEQRKRGRLSFIEISI